MENGLNKRYGLLTAITMIVGIVIGSGVFFKAEKILKCTGGDMMMGVAAWIAGGCIMIVCAYSFANMAAKYQRVNGIVDYAEEMVSTDYGYYMGWFQATMYFPAMTSVLAWVTAKYICILAGWDATGGECMVIAGFSLVASYALNTLSPLLAGKIQVSTTVIKMIPLLLIAVIGTIKGLHSGLLAENFSNVIVEPEVLGGKGNMMFTAVCATAFAYEGWIIATSINAELKDAKKTLPKALVIGTFIVMLTYVTYYIGVSGSVENSIMMEDGELGARMTFTNIFSSVGGSLLFVFVIVSCIGTLNGLMLGCIRGMYSIGVRNQGPRPDVFKQVDPAVNSPYNSAAAGLLLCSLWLVYYYGANLTDSWFGVHSFDSSELPIVTIYAMYIPIFARAMKKEKDWGIFKRFIMPAVSILGCLFMVTAAAVSHRETILAYIAVFAAVMIAGRIAKGKGAVETDE